MKARYWLWALLGVAVLLVFARSCSAAEQWNRVAQVEDVAVTVTQVTELELARLRSRYEPIDRSALGRVIPQHRYGFALLFRDKETRAYRCEVYVHDTADAVTLEHELRHCHGWVHQ